MNSSFPPDPLFPSNLGPDTGRRATTEPAHPDAFREDLRQLRAALADVGALLARVDTHLCRLELAELTSEHRLNVVQESATVHAKQLEDHEVRLAKLESTAAE